MLNPLWNRRCGPGGSTRRLHQYPRFFTGHAGGAETGSTRAVKAKSVSVMVRSLSGQALKCQR